MNIKEAIKIIKDEKLQGYNMNEERYNRENEVVLRCENDKWIVYATDERASKVTNLQITLKRNASSATAERLFHF